MDADRHVELLGRFPHHVVGAVGECASPAGVGTDEAGNEPELCDGSPKLLGCGRRILQGEHGRPEEPARIGGAIPGEPVVVGARQGDRGSWVLDHGEVETDGGIQDRLVDALAVHVAQTGHGVRPARQGVGQRAERVWIVERGAGAGEIPERHRQDLGVAHDDVLVARGIRPDAGSELLGQRRPGRLGLDDVAVCVDDGAGTRRERRPAARRHPGAVRQSLTSGSRWRNRRLALPPATARSSSSGSTPQVAASTRCVSGHEESACG